MFADGNFSRSRRIGVLATILGLLTGIEGALGGEQRRPPRPDGRGSMRWIDPVFETRYRTVVDPAVFETRSERIWIEPQYREQSVRVVVPAVFEEQTRRVWREPVVEYRPIATAGIGFNAKRIGIAIACAAPQPVVVVPGHWESVCERVCVRPEAVRIETQRVCVQSGRWEVVERRICVKPECSRVVAEQVCVAPGRWTSDNNCAPLASIGTGFNVNFAFRR